MNKILQLLSDARYLAENKNYEDSWNIVQDILTEDPHNAHALVTGSFIMEKAKRLPMAYYMAKHAIDVKPNESACWVNYGMACDSLYLKDEAIQAYEKALELSRDDVSKAQINSNLSALYINFGEFDKALPYAQRALKLKPDFPKAEHNLGMIYLSQMNWEPGWKHFSKSLGTRHRIKQQFKNEPEWDGTKGKKVVIYGEQGLGDEISFASMIPDAIKSARITLECDPRLENLYKRSFDIEVHGTRNRPKPWVKDLDASIAVGELGKLYRLKNEDFPGTPYLKADPERVTMWKALWNQKDKPVIGIAWTGGTQWNAGQYRKLDLESLLPLFKSVDAHWVCLQYKDAQEEIDNFTKNHKVDIKQYPFATLTKDYDDTTALVDSLDYVVSMQTAVVHLCGALGKDCAVLVPDTSQWRYAAKEFLWNKSVKVFRQEGNWKNTIFRVKNELTKRFPHLRVLPKSTKKAS